MKNFETSTTYPIAMPVVRLEAVARNRTSLAPMAAVAGSALRPTTDVDTRGFAVNTGVRSWSPPV